MNAYNEFKEASAELFIDQGWTPADYYDQAEARAVRPGALDLRLNEILAEKCRLNREVFGEALNRFHGQAKVVLPPRPAFNQNAVYGKMCCPDGSVRAGVLAGTLIRQQYGRAKSYVSAYPSQLTRDVNKTIATVWLENPPREVLDGFGYMRGRAWERYQRAVIGSCEDASCREPPRTLTSEDLESAMEQARGEP